MGDMPEEAAAELRTLLEAKLREKFHETGFCPDCCLLCGWCPDDDTHPCMSTAEPQGLVQTGGLGLADGTPFPPLVDP